MATMLAHMQNSVTCRAVRSRERPLQRNLARGTPGTRRMHAPRAFYYNSCGPDPRFSYYNRNASSSESAKRMKEYMEEIAKQMGASGAQAGAAGGAFFWPGGGFYWRPGSGFSSSAQKDQQQDESGTMDLPVDVIEQSEAYTIYADVPGLKRGDLTIKLLAKERVLAISGDRTSPIADSATGQVDSDVGDGAPRWTRRERRSGRFERRVSLPENADVDGIRARVTDGILAVTVPKKVEKEDNDARDVPIA